MGSPDNAEALIAIADFRALILTNYVTAIHEHRAKMRELKTLTVTSVIGFSLPPVELDVDPTERTWNPQSNDSQIKDDQE